MLTREKLSVAQVARDFWGLGAIASQVWVAEAKQESGGGLSFEELARLRREVRNLKMERDILKKASILFAKGGS